MNPMTVLQMCAHFGVRHVMGRKFFRSYPDDMTRIPLEETLGEGLQLIGEPPTFEAALYHTSEGFVIYTIPGSDLVDGILHELCHVLVGPDSLMGEEALMPFQWQLMQLLPPDQYKEARQVFALYSMGDGELVGPTDEFLTTSMWNDGVQAAISKGVLNTEGQLPVDLSIPINTWKCYLDRTLRSFP